MKSNVLLVLVGILLLLVGGMGGYIYFQSQPKSTTATSEVVVSTPVPSIPAESHADAMVQANTPTPAVSTKVTIENEASFPALDVSELKARVINPFVDYNMDAYPDDALVSVTVKKNTQASSVNYPYLLDSVSTKGVTHGVSISRTNGHIDWWLPECMGSCNLTPAFKAKYPEIASKTP